MRRRVELIENQCIREFTSPHPALCHTRARLLVGKLSRSLGDKCTLAQNSLSRAHSEIDDSALTAAAADHGSNGLVGTEIFRALDIEQR